MKRKALTMLLALTLVFSIVGVSLAGFDYSVFENNENFEVEFDVMDDTGSISFASAPLTAFKLVSEKTFILSMMNIYGMPDIATLIRFQFIVYGSWPDTQRVILLPDKTRYTVETKGSPKSDTAGLYEVVTIPFSHKLIPMLEEVVEKEITSIKYRLDGDTDIDGEIIVDVENLKTLLDLYKAAGGLKQDMTIVDAAFPVTVK